MDSLKLLVRVLENYEVYAESIESIEPMLDALWLFMNRDDSNLSYLTYQEDMVCLSNFYHRFAIKTLDHRVWKLLWSKLSICNLKYRVLDWLDIKDLDFVIENSLESDSLQNFMLAFSSDDYLACHIFEVIRLTDSDKQKKLRTLLFQILKEKNFYLFILIISRRATPQVPKK